MKLRAKIVPYSSIVGGGVMRKASMERADWQGWCVGYWTDFNHGGWTWHGHSGEVTHVASLPAPPLSGRKPGPSISGEPRG